MMCIENTCESIVVENMTKQGKLPIATPILSTFLNTIPQSSKPISKRPGLSKVYTKISYPSLILLITLHINTLITEGEQYNMAAEYLEDTHKHEKLKTKMYLRSRLGALRKFRHSLTEQIKALVKEQILIKKYSREEHNSRESFIEETDKYPHLELMFGSCCSFKKLKESVPVLEETKKDIIFTKHGVKVRKSCLKAVKSKIKTLTNKLPLQTSNDYSTKKTQWLEKNSMSPHPKLFIITGNYPDVRKALLNRGWVENVDTSSPFFDFKWALKHKEVCYVSLQETQIVNHYANTWELTTKVGLLYNLRNLIWTHNVDCDRFFPRAFDLSNNDFKSFIEEFKLSKAETVLKTFVNKNKKISEIGRAKLVLSMCITQRRINAITKLELNHSLITETEWELIACHEILEQKILSNNLTLKNRVHKLYEAYAGTDNEETNMKRKAKELLAQFSRTFPQSPLTEEFNLWILKPAGLSRGRGIHVLSNLRKILELGQGKNYIVQKYIENPMLIYGRKFDIRIWVMVTNWNPATVWIYDEVYVRFGAENYNPELVCNKFIHLTNNAVSKGFPGGLEKICGNMWSQKEFVEYLNKAYGFDVWDKVIKQKIASIIRWSLIAVQEYPINRAKSFEIFGYDIMIDQNCKPWLIEVNSSPSMDYSTVCFCFNSAYNRTSQRVQ
eukprot:TRINITY_DN3239_c0_g2_i1.p1 TRINITY_DN3239_c0_g2~~TRINITY_DN3239_c0_g2_i1.p1  ORF type:complete len:671 (+),score=38.95 TRINITY_DN3239_c0_g2_i1:2947-4959(+)